jgi:ribosomal protein S18 acetylase RimI-like enzyme
VAWHSQPVHIRAAQELDLVTLHEIVERAYGVYIRRIGRRPAPMDDDYSEKLLDGHVFVADARNKVAGLIVLVPAQDHLLIENVAVDPERQGKGVGRSLLAYAETYATKHHIPELRLYTNAAMTENLALYQHLGYREDGRRTENGLKRVFFSKRLVSSELETGSKSTALGPRPPAR